MMAQTPAQLLAAAKKRIAATQAAIDAQTIASTPASTRVDTTSLAGIEAASKAIPAPAAPTAQQIADDKYATEIVSNGKTQAQIDALANARSTAALIRDTSTTMTSKVDPATGMVITTPKGTSSSTSSTSSSANSSSTNNSGTKNYTASDGKVFDTEAAMVAYETDLRNTKLGKEAQAAADLRDRQSAYDLLYNEFNKYGLGSLVEGIKGLIQSNVSPSQFAIELQNTKEYQARFSANQERIAQGLKALTPAEYIGMEDQYQNIMRNYGLPSSYWSKDATGKQAGFDKFLANDVSATELENRIATAQQRVVNSNPEVLQALKQFYPDISNGDILAYALDPKNALDNINRKVTAAEIGGAALAQGLQALGGTAESLAGAGITKAQAQQGYTNVAEMLPRGSQLADIYNQGPYNQGTAEAEVFNTAGAAEAAKKRKKLTALETASFSGSSGVGSLNRDRAVSNYMLGQPGAGSY